MLRTYNLINFRFKIEEIGMSYKEIRKFANKDISFLGPIDLESEIRNNYKARDKFLIHIMACKEDLEDRVDEYLSKHPNDDLREYSRKLFSFTSCSLFNEFIFETPKWKELNIILGIIFITGDKLNEIYEDIKLSLEDERESFSSEEYLKMLRNEFCEVLKTL